MSQSWKPSTLGQLGRYLNGRGFKKQEWSATGRPIIRIQNLTGSNKEFHYFNGEADPRHVAQPGDLLVSWAATLGAYIWNGPEAVVNQHIFKVESNIDRMFHKYLLDYKLTELKSETHGSGMVHITRPRFDALPVLIPDAIEQRRIVEMVEEHLSHLDAADAALGTALTRSTSLVEAALARALPDWTGRAPLADLLETPLSNGRSVPSADEGFPVLRLTALKAKGIDLSERKIGAWTEQEACRFLVKQGDFLVARGNGSKHLVGRGSLLRAQPDAVAFPDTTIRIRPNHSQLRPDYLALVWNSIPVRRQIEAMARTTAGIYKINQKQLAEVQLPLPSLEDQREIERHIGRIAEAVDQQAVMISLAQQRSTALRRAVLAAAFSGRLTGHASDDVIEELTGH